MNDGQTPPPPPPPAPGAGFSGDSPFTPEPFETPTRRSTPGGLIALGILNILFALVCGCINGMGAVTIAGLGEADTEFVSGKFDEEMQRAFDREIAKADSEEQRRALREAKEFMTSPEFQKVIAEVMRTVADSPAASMLGTLTGAAAVIQLAFLISGCLLLSRVRFARGFTIAVALATLVITVATVVYVNQVTDEVGGTLRTQLEEELQKDRQDVDPKVREMLEAMSDAFGTPLKGVWTVMGGISAIYPFIVVLIMLFSRGIQSALSGPVRVGGKPEAF